MMMIRAATLLAAGLWLGQIFACAGSATPNPGAGETSPTPPPPPSASPSLQSVAIGHFPSTTGGGIYIARERGYFREQGIEAELTPFSSLPDAAMLLNSGKLDLYAGGTGANLFNAVLRGVEMRVVADKSHSEAGVKYKAIVARRDLWDSGTIRGLADLRGRTVGMLVSTGGQEYQLAKLLAASNLTESGADS
jgi:NitT/TauT family transport system substrate-binding protein